TFDMDSMPPLTTMSASPSRIVLAPNTTAWSPEPQTLLTVVVGTVSGILAFSDACRAGACPMPADRTLPMNTSSTSSGWSRGRETGAGERRGDRRCPELRCSQRGKRPQVRADRGARRADDEDVSGTLFHGCSAGFRGAPIPVYDKGAPPGALRALTALSAN